MSLPGLTSPPAPPQAETAEAAALRLARASLEALALKGGEVIQAKVLGTAGNGLTQLSLDGQLLNVKLPQPLPPGTQLHVTVQVRSAEPQGLPLLVVQPRAAPRQSTAPAPPMSAPAQSLPMPAAAVLQPAAQAGQLPAPAAPIVAIAGAPGAAAAPAAASQAPQGLPTAAPAPAGGLHPAVPGPQAATPPVSMPASSTAAPIPAADANLPTASVALRSGVQLATPAPTYAWPPPARTVPSIVATLPGPSGAPAAMPSSPSTPQSIPPTPVTTVLSGASASSPLVMPAPTPALPAAAQQMTVPPTAPPVSQSSPPTAPPQPQSANAAALPPAAPPLSPATPMAGPSLQLGVHPLPVNTAAPAVLPPALHATAAPAPPLPPRPAAPLMQATFAQAAAQQDSIAPLLQNLSALQPRSGDFPRPVMEAALRLLAGRLNLDRGAPTGEALKRAVLRSGIFFEALAKPAAGQLPLHGDTKAALLHLRGALTAWLGEAIAPVAPISRRLPPPTRGAQPRAERSEPPTLPQGVAPKEAARMLLGQTEAALSRLRLSQLASLPQETARTAAGAPAVVAAEWHLEIPLVLGHELAVAQLQISREGKGPRERRERGWRMQFSLNFSLLGEVGASVSLLGRSTSVVIWAEADETAAALTELLPELAPALVAKGIEVSSVRVRRGRPTEARPQSGQLLDSVR